MKQIFTLFTLLTLMASVNAFAGTTYTVSSNSSYSASCSNCTFNISAGITLTLNSNGTCANCTFNGGIIAIAANVKCQPCSFNNDVITMGSYVLTPNSGSTSFSGVTFSVSGTGYINANTPVTVTNSTFTFTNTSYFYNNGGQLDITGSTLKFNDNSYFFANAGPVNMKSKSYIIVGDGSTTSKAYIKLNGPTLNVYDASSAIILNNYNNYYYNYGSYNSISNSTSYATAYPNAASSLNCGGAGQNACATWGNPVVYGPATFSATGVSGTATTLPVVLTDFSVILTSNQEVALSWNTQEEMNSSYFEVERSINGITWENVATIRAKGNSATVSNYNYTDVTAVNGVAYYRLKMVDLDGQYMYSEIKVVRSTLVKGISFFPNPARDFVNVSLSQSSSDVTVQLINQAGQVLQERKASAGNATTITMQVNQYAQGMYVLRVASADGSQQASKLVIAH
ncbi:MAG: T9SS type A sorting domain-containing protein [Bacteroidetes bacterium]|nr:T9SS type A sorting domain-containing protein [Bacteroidota bacterium]